MPPRQDQPDTESVFYVHPSEGPNSVVVAPPLDGSNYLAWSRSMIRAFGAKNKLKFIDGSMEIPDEDDLNRSAWERCNHLIQSWIINSVSPQIAQTLVFHENAIDAWSDLKERFAKVDRIRIATLRSKINNLKQGSKTVLEYFTEMKTLVLMNMLFLHYIGSLHIVKFLLNQLIYLMVPLFLLILLVPFILLLNFTLRMFYIHHHSL